MVNRAIQVKTQHFKIWVTLLFLLLAIGLEAFIAFYWFRVLEPQLMGKAEITARALAQPGIGTLAEALTLAEADDPSPARRAMERAVDQVLLLSDPHAGSPFINQIEVVIDYDAVNAPEGSLDMVRGGVDNDDSFETEIPIYSPTSRELLGVARLHNSREVFRYFKKDVQSSFAAGAVIILVFLAVAWWIVTGLLGRIRRAEEALQEKQAQVVHAGRLTAMGEMATGIAHELNQPLAIIRVAAEGLCEHFSNEKDTPEEAREAKKIVSQVVRAASIIDNMRSFARNGEEQSDAVDLRIPIEKALSFFREQFRIHGIRLDVNLPAGPLMVKIHPGKFQQILVNLLTNARHAVEEKDRYSVPGGPKHICVHLTSEASDDTAILEVEDNGVGMSPEVRERCMEPFFTTKDVGEGTGLGLSIAHGIAREFDMTLEVTSVEKKGTIFRIRMKREN